MRLLVLLSILALATSHRGNAQTQLLTHISRTTADQALVPNRPTIRPADMRRAHSEMVLPDTIPFVLRGSRIYFSGRLNGQHDVSIEFDLGAGTSAVNATSSDRLLLSFDGTQMLSNTQGVNEARMSKVNTLTIGPLTWSGLSLTEVGNMKPDEDLIVGNGLFRNKVIEIDYDHLRLIVHDRLPSTAKTFRKQRVVFEQDRPKFEATFKNGGHTYAFWFLFDTGRDGSMLIGEDLTGRDGNWKKLQALQMLNGKKIVRLDAVVGGEVFKDVVTNAADPGKPGGRPSLFGNQILSHFNVILDNRKGYLYLKPNGRVNEPYADYRRYLKDVTK